MARILAVDDNEEALFALTELLKQNGFEVFSAASGTETLKVARSEQLDLILLDVQMPGPDGIAVTKELKADPELRYIPIVLLTAKAELEDVVDGLEAGADGFIAKPYRPVDLLARIKAALRTRALYQELERSNLENSNLKSQIIERSSYANLIGSAPSMQQLYALIDKVKNSHLPVLITGESGTGKELVASAIHYGGARAQRNFVAQNCSAFSESLLESELFGHVKGAFTGALRDKAGLFELADGGTLFLDEIGEMKALLQAKLLRVLQDGTFTPVGSTRPRKVDVRIIAATHRDLEAMIQDGSFREDLYYRLNVVRLRLPPLRERAADIPNLVSTFLKKIAERSGSNVKLIAPAAMKALANYRWPGNIRELQNEVERMALLSDDPTTISLSLMDPRIVNAGNTSQNLIDNSDGSQTLGAAIAKLERHMIEDALKRHDWNKSEVARVLGISRSNLISKVQEYGLENKE